jgi:hypothetical protein
MIEKSLTDEMNPTDKIGNIMPVGTGENLASSSQSFSSYMQNVSSVDSGTAKSQMISPFELVNSGPKVGMATPNIDTLAASVKLAQNTFADLQTQLNSPDLKLKASQKYLVQNKLEDVNSSLRAANAKLGAPEVEPVNNSSSTGPLSKFLNYVSDGMNQLTSAQQQIGSLKDKGSALSAADFLMIQLKMNKAQQELDFTSILLSKAVEGVKMLMNVQL